MRWRFAQESASDKKKGLSGGGPTINSVMSKLPGEDSEQLSTGMQVNDIDPASITAQPIESNARLVEWSDGSYGLMIGDEVFDIRQEDLPESGIFLMYGSGAQKELALLKDTID